VRLTQNKIGDFYEWLKIKLLSRHYVLWRGFGGLEGACWSLVPKFVGSHPAEAVGFLERKILRTPSFGGEVKPSVPCRSFTACKRSLNVTFKSAFRQNYRTFLAHSSTFRRWVLSRATRVETPGSKSWNVYLKSNNKP
jgi:hypothetical protein